MPETQNYLKIGEVAQLSGLSLRTIRYYEELEFIKTETRTSGNYRLYSPRVVKILNTIKNLQGLDYSLDEIKMLLAKSYPQTKEERFCVSQNILTKQRERIAEKLSFYLNLRHEIDFAMQKLEKICQQCIAKTSAKEIGCEECCTYLNFHVV